MSRRGLTLVETLVVTGVIVLLAGLVAGSLSAAGRIAERARTRTTLQLLDEATRAYEAKAGPLRWSGAGPVVPGTPYVFVVTQVFEALRRVPDAAAALARIEPRFVGDYEAGEVPAWIRFYEEEIVLPAFAGDHTVLDAWGTPIYATHPGPIAEPDADPDEVDADGTIRTVNERDFGSALHRRVCFTSAGPDRRFGVPHEFPGITGAALEAAMEEARRDNLSSYGPAEPIGAS